MKKTRTKKAPQPADRPTHEILVKNTVDVGRDTGEGYYRPGSSDLPGCTMSGSEPAIEYRLLCHLEFGDLVALTARYHGIKDEREISDLRMVMALWGYFPAYERRAFRRLMDRRFKDDNTELDAIALFGPGKQARDHTSHYMLPTDPEARAALDQYLKAAPKKAPPMKQQLADIAARGAAARAEAGAR